MKKDKTFFLDILSTITKYFLIFISVVIVGLMCSGIRVVKSGEVALVLRFGKLVGDNYEEQVRKPGLLFAFPSFIDEVIIIPSNNVMEQTVDTHYTGPDGLTGWDGGYLITGDQNIAVVSSSVKYVVSNPVQYALNVKDIEEIINATVSSALLNEAADIAVDSLLTTEKDEFGMLVKKFAMEKIDKLQLGIEITSLELTNVQMPNEVKFIYDEVNAATVRAETILEEAQLKKNSILSKANEKYSTLIARAKVMYENGVAGAEKEMAEFKGYLKEYETNPDLLKKRLYSAKLIETINKIETVRLVNGGETVIITPKE